MRGVVLAATVGGCAYAWASAAGACSCLPPQPPTRAAEEADAVFEGRAISRTPSGGKLHFDFDVLRIWKGELGSRTTVITASSGAACGRSFEDGRAYVIYAYRRRDGTLGDGLCTRTRATDAAAEDLAALGPAIDPHGGGGGPIDPDARPVEPPRIEPALSVPPIPPKKRGCAIGEKPHAPWAVETLVLLGLCIATTRRR